MWLQVLHFTFLGLQCLVGWKFLVIGLEVNPDVAQRLGLTDINRRIYPYLTVWNLVFHIVYIGLCVMEDALIAFTYTSKFKLFKGTLQKYRALLFESIVFPGSLVVFTCFWSLTLMDPLYLFPGPIEDLIPAWINFFIHSGIMIFAVGELLLRPQVWASVPRKMHAILGLSVMLIYGITILFHFFSTQFWIYPFLELLSWSQRLGIFLALIAIAIIYYALGSLTNHILYGKQQKRKVTRGQKKLQRKKKH